MHLKLKNWNMFLAQSFTCLTYRPFKILQEGKRLYVKILTSQVIIPSVQSTYLLIEPKFKTISGFCDIEDSNSNISTLFFFFFFVDFCPMQFWNFLSELLSKVLPEGLNNISFICFSNRLWSRVITAWEVPYRLWIESTLLNSYRETKMGGLSALISRSRVFCVTNPQAYLSLHTKINKSLSLSLWRNSLKRTRGASFLRFLDWTKWRTTVGRVPLDEGSARHKEIYLKTQRDRYPWPRRDSNLKS
jgi:hypothetical protein